MRAANKPTSITAVLGAFHKPPLIRAAECQKHGAFDAKCYVGTTWTTCPTCQADSQRIELERDAAAEKALKLAEWEAKLGRAGIPERFRDRTLQSFRVENAGQQTALDFAVEYANGFDAVLKTGRCAIFVGSPGTGKTHLAVGIGLRAMGKHRASVLFMTVQRAIRSIKDTWGSRTGGNEGKAVEALVYPDLLVLDEVGVQSGSEFEKNVLFDVLNERYERRKPTIFLSNLAKEEVQEFLGERVWDRLKEDGCRVVPFGWASQRGRADQ